MAAKRPGDSPLEAIPSGASLRQAASRARLSEAGKPPRRQRSRPLATHRGRVAPPPERTEEPLSLFRLSAWALEAMGSGLVLLRQGRVVLGNARWRALARSGPWRALPPTIPEGAAGSTLRRVVIAEVAALLAGEDSGPRVRRYQREGTEETLELRMERGSQQPPGLFGAGTALVLIQDVTPRARTEQALERAHTTLIEHEHLRALGQMASGIAHDLNNTLNAMKLRLELIQRDPALAERHGAHLNALARIVNDAGMRVHRLQDFARQRSEPRQGRVQLADVIREALEIARSDIEHRAASEGLTLRLETELPPLPLVRGEAADLRYVFINLLLNARDAMPRGGTIRVRGAVVDGTVRIAVEDEGTGIPQAHLSSLFQPFFTTKGARGTGLGLSMAHSVVSRVGGTLSAANRPEGGAVFTLTFPALGPAETLPPPPAPPAPAPSPRRGTRVLVIVEDAASREAILLALEAQGARAEGVSSGREALKRVREGPRYALVLCDVGLSELDGWKVARRLRALAPALPVYLLTDSQPDLEPKGPRRRGVRGLLTKPLSLGFLQELLANLSGPAAPVRVRAGGSPRRPPPGSKGKT